MSNEIMIRMEQIVKTYYIGQPNELEILHGINLEYTFRLDLSARKRVYYTQ